MIKSDKKKIQSSDVFVFPPTSQGLETVQSVFQLMSILRQKFRKSYRNRPDIRLQYQFTFPNFYSYVQGLQYVKLIAHCKYCSHQLVYFKNQSFQQTFTLMAFRNYHVHTRDPKKIRQVYMKTAKDAPRVYRYQPYYLKILRVKNQKHDPLMTAEQYFKSLPIQIKMFTRMKLVMERYGLTESQFNALARKVNSQYQITLKQLFQGYDRSQIVYAYAPHNILQQQKHHLNRKKNLHYAYPLYPEPQVSKENEVRPQSIQFVDSRNPHIPNILIIITPRMKELYRQFGQYVGFDLTFSIIRERPTQHKQFLVGVFGGSTQSKRIIIYGLIITNSQTVEAYKFIFSQFFRLMGSCPSAVLTDEQKPLYCALKQLRQQGLFKGNHYFDMFHIMKKFRKSADGNCFQLYRKILHVSNKAQYRILFNQLKNEVNNDKELNLLRIFDSNSEKFCFSQINAEFVGASISNSINQKFHDILKYNLPFETKYIKAVTTMLQISSELNDSKQPDLQMYPLQQSMNIPFLKPYRTIFSRSAFKIIMREVGRSGRHILQTQNQEKRANMVSHKLQHSCQGNIKIPKNFNKTEYYIQTETGPFKVYKKFHRQESIMNESPTLSKKKGKWYCMCEFEQKSGILCSHIIKVLLHLGEDFMNNLHKRWVIKPEQITNRIRNFRYVGKFSALRSKHKIRVKGYKGMNRNNLFGNYSKEYQPDLISTIDGENTEQTNSQTKSSSKYLDSQYTSLQSSNMSPPLNYQRQKKMHKNNQLESTPQNQFHLQEQFDEQRSQECNRDIQQKGYNDEDQDF